MKKIFDIKFIFFCCCTNISWFNFQKSANYETVHELTYIDMCMNEAMRLYPPGFL